MGNAAAERPQRRSVAVAIITIAVVAMIGIVRTYVPTAGSYYPKCVLHEWTGLHCPGCGGTRALHALAHGELAKAIRFNPLLVLGGPVIAAWIVMQRRRERLGSRAAPRIVFLLACVLIVYCLARNLPSPTRSWLAPPAVGGEDTVMDDRTQLTVGSSDDAAAIVTSPYSRRRFQADTTLLPCG